MTNPTPDPITPLCTFDDVSARCVDAPDPAADQARIQALIMDASSKISRFTRRSFGHGSITKRLRPTGGVLLLPQTPVVSVDAVAPIDFLGNVYPIPVFGFDGIDRIYLSQYASVLNLPEELLSLGSAWAGSVQVTWTYGYASVPDDVASLCAELVSRDFNTPGRGRVGVALEKIGPYETRLSAGPGGVTGVVRLTDDDKVQLRDYCLKASSIELIA